MKFRAQLNKQLEEYGVKLSVNDFIIKACALALQEVLDANAVQLGDRILAKPSMWPWPSPSKAGVHPGAEGRRRRCRPCPPR